MQTRKVAVDQVKIGRRIFAAGERIGGGHQVFFDREVFKHTATFHNVAQAVAHQLLWCQGCRGLAVEVNAAAFDHTVFQRQQARNGLERGALARPIAAQQRHDLPPWHGQRQAAQGLHHLVVDDLDVVDFEDVGRGMRGHGKGKVRA
ncbi:hypothetical protein D3C72_1336570 [compost metagenome]